MTEQDFRVAMGLSNGATVETQQLVPANHVLLNLSLGKPGRKREGNKALALKTDADPELLELKKSILTAESFNNVVEYDRYIVKTIDKMSLPANRTLRGGIKRVPFVMVKEIETFLASAMYERAQLVDRFIAEYPELIKQDEQRLGSQFDADDYPVAQRVKNAFTFRKTYLLLAGSIELPAEAVASANQGMQEALQECKEALRVGFAVLVDRAVERLKVGIDGKKAIFRDSLVVSIEEFLKYFEAQNSITNDQELAALVSKTREVMYGVNAEGLRNNLSMRENVQKSFEGMQAILDTQMQVVRKRAIAFEEDEETQQAA